MVDSPATTRPTLFALALALGAACVGGQTPQDAVGEYAGAVGSDNADRAWRLMSPTYRASISRDRFDAEFAARVAAGDDYEAMLDEAAARGAELTAELPYSEFDTVELVYVGDEWRITSGVGGFFSQATPRDTLRTFVRAVERGDTATLLRLVPGEYRAQITEEDLSAWLEVRADELTETVGLLEASADVPIREREGEATLRYGARTMEFALESGRWVISDF